MLEKFKQYHFDNFLLGLLIGLFTPFLAFFLYWLFKYNYIGFPSRFIWFLKFGGMWEGVVKLCVLTNVLPFYLFLNKYKNKTAAGIIVATIIFVFYIIYLMYFEEIE